MQINYSQETEVLRQIQNTKYDTSEYDVNEIVSGELFRLVPQRFGSDLDIGEKLLFWTPVKQSLFVESVLLGLPLPFIVLCKRDFKTMEIVDGVQRIFALYSFVDNDLRLSGLRKLTQLNGFSYSELTVAIQRKFQNRVLQFVFLEGDTPSAFKRDLFNRLNGGEKRRWK